MNSKNFKKISKDDASELPKAAFKLAEELGVPESACYDKALIRLVAIADKLDPNYRRALREFLIYLDYQSPELVARMVLALREVFDTINELNAEWEAQPDGF